MNALALMATLGLDTSNYEKGLKGAGGMAQNFASSFKKVLGGVAIAGGASVTAAGAAVVKIVKSAVTEYKDYEQLVGGVETLFGNGGKSFEQYAESASDSLYSMGQRGEEVLKIQRAMVAAGYDIGESGADGIYGPKTKAAFDAYAKAGGQLVREAYNDTNAAAKKVQKNADEAYKTAGLSANEYMETVTSFSAALITSLGGDTDKAADVADMAVRDMSDNANKMGTDMSMIQNAYAGFARGNYTMLDNLKLGFAGTKEGMQDLIKKANELRKAQGKSANLTINSYADIVEAIHEVQNEWGITGTTAAEAADTIEGSLNSTKAAWKNLLVSFATGKDINKRLDSLVESGKNVVKNIMPVVTTSLKSIGTFIGEVAPIIANELPGIITEVGPAFLNAAGSLIGSFVSNVPAMLGGIGGAIKKAIVGDENASWPEVGTAIHNGIKEKFSGGIADLKSLLGIEDGTSWNEIGLAISNGAKSVVTEGVSFVKNLLGIEEGVSWTEIGSAISSGAKTAVTEGVNFVKGLLGIEEGASWGEVGSAIVNGAKTAVTDGTNFIKGLLGLEEGASWDEVGGAIGRGARSFLTGTSNFIQDLLGIKEGMSFDEIGSAIESGAKSFVNAGANFVKELLGIDGEPWTEVGDSIVGGIESAWNTYKETMEGIREFFGGGTDDGENRYKQGYDYFGGKTYTNGTGGGRLKVPVDAEVQGFAIADGVEAVIDCAAEVSSIETSKIDGTLKNTVQAELDATSLPEYEVNGNIGGQVQQQLDGTKLPDYVANVSIVYHEGENGGSYGRGRVKQEKNARAMANGRIFNRPTIFGYADGAYQMAGDAGPEAVVGVSSLRDMIRDAVGDQLGAILNGMSDIRAGQGRDMQLVLDSGELVGGIANKMNRRLGSISRWREGGHA